MAQKIPCPDCGYAIDPREDGENCPVCGYDYTEDHTPPTDEPADYDPDAVTLEVGTKELRGEGVRALDISIRVPESVLREIQPDVIDHLADDLPDGLDIPGEAWDYAKEHHPRVVSDYLNERLRWEFRNVDLPDTCPE